MRGRWVGRYLASMLAGQKGVGRRLLVWFVRRPRTLWGAGVALIFAAAYRAWLVEHPQVIVDHEDERMLRLLRRCGAYEPYMPTFWAAWSYPQLLVFMLWQKYHEVRTRFVVTPVSVAGATLTYAELEGVTLPAAAPVVVMLHGITGSHLALASFARSCVDRGFRPVVINRRGHSTPLSSPSFDVFGHVEDTVTIIDRVAARYPAAPIGVVGVSAGSGQLVIYLGSDRVNKNVVAGACLCPGYDLTHCMHRFSRRSPLLSRYITRSAKELFLYPNRRVLQNHDPAAFARCDGAEFIHEFITHASVYAGHADYESYLQVANPMQYFLRNKTPCLVLSARDDPVCLESCIPFSSLPQAPFGVVVTKRGSHTCYREGWFGQGSYMERITLQFLGTCFSA